MFPVYKYFKLFYVEFYLLIMYILCIELCLLKKL